MTTPILSCRDIEVTYGGLKALDKVSLDVSPGKFSGLIGPNGSGKTTMINIITGAVALQKGSIELNGKPIGKLPMARRVHAGIARTFQNLRLFDTMSVIDNVMMGAHRHYRSSALESCFFTPRSRREQRELKEKAEDLISVFGERLRDRHDHQVVRLSYANRRRVEIARALMSEPDLLLLDEPAAGMNPAETEELVGHLRTFARKRSFGMLLVEHKMDFISELCTEVRVLDHGVILAEGSPAEIQNNPKVVEAFLGIE